MALIPTKIGVPVVNIGVPDPTTTLPSMSAVVPQVCAINPADYLINDVKIQLQTGINYQFMVALVGFNASQKGYSFSQCSQGSGLVQTSNGMPAVRVYIPTQATVSAASSLPSGYDSSIMMAVFGRKGASTSWQLYQLAYIDPGNDFNDVVLTEALPGNVQFTQALLQSVTPDTQVLGDRTPIGVKYQLVQLTSGGVTVLRDVATVRVPPDNSPDFTVATSRAANIQFSGLVNSPKEFVRASGGEEAQFAGDAGSTIQITRKTLLTAQAVLKGNAPIKFNMPLDNSGVPETRLYTGNLTLTQKQVREVWKKDAVTLVEYDLETAAQDAGVINQHTEMAYKRGLASFTP